MSSINLEALNRFECYFVNTMADLQAHVERVNHPFIRGMYDTFHCNIEEKDPVGAIAKHVKAIDHVHISENDRGTPGRGHIDFAAVFKALKAANYDGWLHHRGLRARAGRARGRDQGLARFLPDPKQVYQEGFTVIRDGWAK